MVISVYIYIVVLYVLYKIYKIFLLKESLNVGCRIAAFLYIWKYKNVIASRKLKQYFFTHLRVVLYGNIDVCCALRLSLVNMLEPRSRVQSSFGTVKYKCQSLTFLDWVFDLLNKRIARLVVAKACKKWFCLCIVFWWVFICIIIIFGGN